MMEGGWQDMKDAHRDGRYILALYDNNLFYEPVVVWWNGDDGIYSWSSKDNAFPESRLVKWHEMPKMYEQDSDVLKIMKAMDASS